MVIIELENKVIYKSEHGKVKFVNRDEEYEEIVLKERKDDLVEEVNYGGENI